jgi:Asp-tRNA(Asn)/Glu-tRNA(Gln) amidotransferase C subunit
MNGMNGAAAAAAAAAGMPLPTPAGHQAELNYIYGMVEELSRQLAENRRVTEDIISGLGKVRNKAKKKGLNNEELVDSAAEDINGTVSAYPSMESVWLTLEKPKNKTSTPSSPTSPNASRKPNTAATPMPPCSRSMPTRSPAYSSSSTSTRPSTWPT